MGSAWTGQDVLKGVLFLKGDLGASSYSLPVRP